MLSKRRAEVLPRVAEVCRELIAAGVKPTGSKLRELIPGYGPGVLTDCRDHLIEMGQITVCPVLVAADRPITLVARSRSGMGEVGPVRLGRGPRQPELAGPAAGRGGGDAVIPVPVRMRELRRDSRGYVVPFFVADVDGKPDFRVADGRKSSFCVRERKCWLCGQGLQRRMTFVLGPMCGLNRTSAEPPCHHEFASYAVQVCPFLTEPRAHRIEHNLPANGRDPAGTMLRRNPGVTLLWVTQTYETYDAGNGRLIRIGDPLAVEYWTEARRATLDELPSNRSQLVCRPWPTWRRDRRPYRPYLPSRNLKLRGGSIWNSSGHASGRR